MFISCCPADSEHSGGNDTDIQTPCLWLLRRNLIRTVIGFRLPASRIQRFMKMTDRLNRLTIGKWHDLWFCLLIQESHLLNSQLNNTKQTIFFHTVNSTVLKIPVFSGVQLEVGTMHLYFLHQILSY